MKQRIRNIMFQNRIVIFSFAKQKRMDYSNYIIVNTYIIKQDMRNRAIKRGVIFSDSEFELRVSLIQDTEIQFILKNLKKNGEAYCTLKQIDSFSQDTRQSFRKITNIYQHMKHVNPNQVDWERGLLTLQFMGKRGEMLINIRQDIILNNEVYKRSKMLQQQNRQKIYYLPEGHSQNICISQRLIPLYLQPNRNNPYRKNVSFEESKNNQLDFPQNTQFYQMHSPRNIPIRDQLLICRPRQKLRKQQSKSPARPLSARKNSNNKLKPCQKQEVTNMMPSYQGPIRNQNQGQGFRETAHFNYQQIQERRNVNIPQDKIVTSNNNKDMKKQPQLQQFSLNPNRNQPSQVHSVHSCGLKPEHIDNQINDKVKGGFRETGNNPYFLVQKLQKLNKQEKFVYCVKNIEGQRVAAVEQKINSRKPFLNVRFKINKMNHNTTLGFGVSLSPAFASQAIYLSNSPEQNQKFKLRISSFHKIHGYNALILKENSEVEVGLVKKNKKVYISINTFGQNAQIYLQQQNQLLQDLYHFVVVMKGECSIQVLPTSQYRPPSPIKPSRRNSVQRN